MIYAGILAGGTGTRMGITDMRPVIFEFGWTFLHPHGWEVLEASPWDSRFVLGIHPDWDLYGRSLMNKYLSSYKDRILDLTERSDRNSINIILYRRGTATTDEDIIVTHDSVQNPFVGLKTIQENIEQLRAMTLWIQWSKQPIPLI